MAISLTLMRHGRSRADDEKVHEGRYDSPLTEVGCQQVQARADYFKAHDFHFDSIIRGAGSYLVVAHGGVLNAALRVIFGAPLPVNGSGLWAAFGDTSFVRLKYFPDRHQWMLLELRPE